ncbi:UDP-galactose transporter [Colletotrichum cereale]|nr:UDP-galactose transporter [Colletotrichum cereale]
MLRHGSVLGFFLKPLGWIPGGPQQAAYAAALGLVAIQVGIGIIMKLSQTGGSYSFSPSASVTISEFFKMVLSSIFFWNECKRRAADGILPSTRGGGSGYSSLATSELPLAERSSLDEKREEEALNGSAASSSTNANGVDHHTGPLPRLDFRTYWSYVRGEVTKDVRYGFCNLALFYVLINNSIFVSYKMADPGTIQLTKSGVTFITALVMIATLNTKISKIQWIAILMQICGLMVTQYNPQTGTTYPFSTYFILLFQVFLSAASGVYNQALLKTDDSSLHADNMILYGAGASMNLLCHLVIKTLKADEPGFFEGYNSFGAIMVIASNVFIGLAITAVYKYADAVIKCFATAVATGILLYVSPVLFGTTLSFLVLPGTVVVFVASWLYMDNPPPKDPNPPTNEPQKMSLFSKVAAVARKFNKIFLTVATFITVLIVAFLTMSEAKMPDFAKEGGSAPSAPSGPEPVTGSENKVESPFKNSVAMIRWNSARPERIPLLRKYEPFFHTVHISMPNMFKGEDPEFHNLTHDQFPGTFTIYKQVSRTMKLILDTQPEIDGLMYYHFDAWVDPLGWTGMNPFNIHFPSVIDTAPPSHGGPEYMCLTDIKNYNWWGWGQDFHRTAMAAASVVDNFGLEYKVRRDEFCVGWSDIYFIPRRFFADFIFLSEIFAGFGVFHEVAIPTIVHIIDQSRRRNPYRSIIDHISDCWGNCCSSNPKIRDVLGARCGHRLDYLEEGTINAFYGKLDAQADLLGQTLNATKYAMASGDAAHLFDSAALASINNGEAKKVAPVKDDGLEDDQRADKLAAEKAKQEKQRMKDEHAPVDKTGNPGDPKADPSKVLPSPPSGDHTSKPKDDKEGATKEEGEKEGGKKVDPNDALREADRDADVKRRLRREIVAAVAGLGY